MNKAESKHLSRVAGLGCIVCLNQGNPDTPAEVHHIRSGVGKAQRSHYTQTISLCPAHHRIGGYGVAFHAGPTIWQRQFGSETDLLAQVNGLLGVEF